MAENERALTDEEALFGGLGATSGAPQGEAVTAAGRTDGGREIFLRVAEALPFDINHGIARLDRGAFEALGVRPGRLIHVTGKRRTTIRAEMAPPGLPGQHVIRMDGTLRDNAQVGIDDRVRVRVGGASEAFAITLGSNEPGLLNDIEMELVRGFLNRRVVTPGDKVTVTALDRGDREFQVVETEPSGPVIVLPNTALRARAPGVQRSKPTPASVRYEDIGGLEHELTRVRELVELPMKYPALFNRLRIEPPKGVLLYGPPGTGKTLIARAVASEVEATFIHVNGPEIMQKYVGESEARLREVFEQAQRDAPSIIFLDELDAIAPKRADVVGEVEKRVVAQLLTLMDGLMSRGEVTVIGATNMPELVDPALRRPGRFDREVPVNAPTRPGRLQILQIHARGLPLGNDVNLDRLAEITHGFVGADLEVLCKEAGMLALHEVLDQADLDTADPMDLAEGARIQAKHFMTALKAIEPTATREVLVEKPEVPWDAVGGLGDVREFLEGAVDFPRRHPELFAEAGIRPPKGILFSGASGTGKSLMARALATATGLSLITANAATLLSKWLGESEKSVRQVFTRAKQAAPCLLFFDELDAIAPVRGGDQAGGAVDRIVSQFLSELDSLDEFSEVVVLGATNRLDLLDPALLSPRRFAFVLEFPLPDEVARREIFGAHTAKMPIADDVDLGKLAAATEAFSGADIAAVCQRAAMQEIRGVIEAERQDGSLPDGGLHIGSARFEEGLSEVRQAILARRSPPLVRLPGGGSPLGRLGP
jgi:transitional endoplasmic reticulum ATPase